MLGTTITGYTVHSPTNDLGMISPTAALAAFPYTPVESMRFLRFLYEKKKVCWSELQDLMMLSPQI